MFYEYDKEFLNNSMQTLGQNLKKSFNEIGKLAKQYMLAGNTNPVTDEEKTRFAEYISQNTDEKNGIYSPDDNNTIREVLFGGNAPDKLNPLLEKLKDSGISDDIKSSLYRVTIGVREIGNPKADKYNELERDLLKLMYKWEIRSYYKSNNYITDLRNNALLHNSINEKQNQILSLLKGETNA